MAQQSDQPGGVGITAPVPIDVTGAPAFIETLNNWARAFEAAVNATPPGIAPPQARGTGPAPTGGIAPPQTRGTAAPNLGPIVEARPPREDASALTPSSGIAAPQFSPAYNQTGYRPTASAYTPEYSAYRRAASTFLQVHPGASIADAYEAALAAVFGGDVKAKTSADPNDLTARNPYREKTAEWRNWQVAHDAAIQRDKGRGPGGPAAASAPPSAIPSSSPSAASAGIVGPGEPNLLPFIAAGDTLTLYENDLSNLPEDVRPYVEQVMRALGYVPTGFCGSYGAKEYVRPPGTPPLVLSDDLISRVTGGDARRGAWLRWFTSRKGLYGAPSSYPMITAPAPG